MTRDVLRTFPVREHSFAGVGTDVPTAVEEPLEVQVRYPGDPPTTLAVLMRTPGDDLDLVAGFLLSERVIESDDHLAELREAGIGRNTHNIVLATLAPGRVFAPRADRAALTAAACGVCGTTAIESTTPRHPTADPASPPVTASLVDRAVSALARGPLAAATGGAAGAALVDASDHAIVVREDAHERFAIDKVIGAALRHHRDPATSVVATTGTASFEVVERVVAFGAPVLVAHGTPTSLAVRMAAEHALTLVGLRDGTPRVFSGLARLGQTASR